MLDANPVAKMKRPKVAADDDGAVWLDKAQMKAFLAAVARHSPRANALAAVMLTTGARVSEVLAADVDDLGHTGGHRVLTVTRKGDRRQNLPIAPWVGRIVDDWLDGRVQPLFATRARGGGHGRLDQPTAFRLIRALATRRWPAARRPAAPACAAALRHHRHPGGGRIPARRAGHCRTRRPPAPPNATTSLVHVQANGQQPQIPGRVRYGMSRSGAIKVLAWPARGFGCHVLRRQVNITRSPTGVVEVC